MSDVVRVLVVDDSATQRCLLQSILKPAGYQIDTASDGVEALAYVKEHPPQLVVTDLKMPHMDGLQLVREISQLQLNVPVILTTAAGSEMVAAEALHAGAASYVPKAGLGRLLLTTVRRILELHKATQQNQSLADCLSSMTIEWKLTNDQSLVPNLIGRVESILEEVANYDQGQQMQIAMALDEAIVNAIVHGNLEVSSDLRRIDDGQPYLDKIKERIAMKPYCDRRVVFRLQVSRNQATFTIRDQGPGFCLEDVADATDPANLEKEGGRGLLLINTFMDEVQHHGGGTEIVMTKYCPEIPVEIEA
ncbi:response regulator [Novipirellula artificiosorum]|uniref:Chemotaxis protein CheY n=1 Tax=Novipirellula artificiosorum TaxID=2528016 RepID=A0A5C6DB87_9BACT|nr:response regulator [Novipirellula artificiosorum]TWU33001.1 Chemotaxis protein CheY [Novipirellula artificiosorum]